MDTWLLENVVLVPMDGPPSAPLGSVRQGAIRIRGASIDRIGDLEPLPGERRIDGRGCAALPGFVQGHVHCCQTLFRGLAEDMDLLRWLRERIWPLEHAHVEDSAKASADLTFALLLRTGTTAVQTMESVRHAEAAFESALMTPITLVSGNCLMDEAEGCPPGMATSAEEALSICERLQKEFDGREGRIHYAVSPRFVLSCSDALSREAAEFARDRGLRVHTHACEHPSEVEAVRRARGMDYIEILERQGLLGPRTSLAHCVHTTARERNILRETDTAVLHCPTTNLKLGSGIAPIAEYLRRGLRVSLGADGAPANNRLSALAETRMAALLQALVEGPGAFPAAAALDAATRGGARALGLEDRLGSLEPGKRADICLFDIRDAESRPGGDLATLLVHGSDDRRIAAVICGGEFAVQDGRYALGSLADIANRAEDALEKLLARAGLAR
ncbi:MAG: 5'-deoxyadenosine deaminase [Planctomycetota bacterium]